MEANLKSKILVLEKESIEHMKNSLESEEWLDVLKNIDVVLANADKGNFNLDSKVFFDKISKNINNFNNVINEQYMHVLTSTNQIYKEKNFKFWTIFTFVITINLVLLFMGVKLAKGLTTEIQLAIEQLTNITKKVVENSISVNTSGSKVASGSTQSSAALQETASALVEIKSISERNREQILMSENISKKSEENVNQGVMAMDEMNQSMHMILESINTIYNQVQQSKNDFNESIEAMNQVNDKLKVINDIVFKTKLLAFNASVEAARAGEHGKGFSVVAEEVGNLAKLSGNSANEIFEVLHSSIKKFDETTTNTQNKVQELVTEARRRIENGNQNVLKCNDVFSKIKENASISYNITKEISLASEEQTTGVSEISRALNELEVATFENVQAANQASVSSEELKNQSHLLQNTVTGLKKVVHG